MSRTVTPKPCIYQNLDYLGGAIHYAEDVFDAIDQGSLYEQINREDFGLLCQFMHCYSAQRGTILLEEGDEGSHLLIVLEGHVLVSKHLLSGQNLQLAIVGPGNVLGEMSLIDGEHRFATCVANEAVKFAVLTRNDLNEILYAHPRLGNKLLIWVMRITIGRVRDMGMQLTPQTA